MCRTRSSGGPATGGRSAGWLQAFQWKRPVRNSTSSRADLATRTLERTQAGASSCRTCSMSPSETRGRCSGSCLLQPRPSWSSHAPTWPTCCSPTRRGAVSSSPRAWPWARAGDISCVRRSPRPCVSAASQVLADCSWRTSRCRGSCGWLRLNCRGSPRSPSTSVSSSSRSA